MDKEAVCETWKCPKTPIVLESKDTAATVAEINAWAVLDTDERAKSTTVSLAMLGVVIQREELTEQRGALISQGYVRLEHNLDFVWADTRDIGHLTGYPAGLGSQAGPAPGPSPRYTRGICALDLTSVSCTRLLHLDGDPDTIVEPTPIGAPLDGANRKTVLQTFVITRVYLLAAQKLRFPRRNQRWRRPHSASLPTTRHSRTHRSTATWPWLDGQHRLWQDPPSTKSLDSAVMQPPSRTSDEGDPTHSTQSEVLLSSAELTGLSRSGAMGHSGGY